eukprot:14932857-Alexandrium_andersonii.AAC.1
MKVVTHMRDLGAHLSLGRVPCNPTGTDRLAAACEAAKAVSAAPMGLANKARVITGKAIPMGVHGSQVAPVSGTMIRKLRTAIARAMDAKAPRGRSLELFFQVAGTRSLDPDIAIWLRR